MSQTNSVNWPLVDKWVQRDGITTNWKVFGAPSIMSTEKSAFSDAVPMPRWAEPPKLILSTAINGAFFTKKENPNQAISPAEMMVDGFMRIVRLIRHIEKDSTIIA